ncbi:HAMP domain-containing protein [Azoarcus communis]|uniref:sensor histidine kinase n=1 Tax=Parazoarcus communis TaxID=41977 RepID=UPI001459F602|nr:sensor histidine kinase [Parazoarcus communis]NMG49738.1 HAMP domain-containing protein [Parazoarcus communis]
MTPRFSLRRRVIAWLLPPLAILVGVNAWLSYRGALEAVNRAYDRSLTASIKAVAEQTHSIAGRVHIDIPYSAFEMFEDKAQERVYYAVIDTQGDLLTGYPDLPLPSALNDSGEVLIVDARYRGEPIRLGAMSKRLYDPALAGGDAVYIVFAETTGSRTTLARDLFLDSLRRQLLLLGVGAVLIVLALGSAFRPLIELRDAIRKRGDEDLTPVPASNVPSEVGPLIDAINHHTERLSALLAARRRFLADAAHQIRTPLAVLTTQAEYGLRQTEPEEMLRTFASLLRSIRATRRLANEMLTMSRAEAVNGLMDERAPVDLTGMVKDVAMELVPLALNKGIDLAFEGPSTPVVVEGNAPMLREMVANLIDNAIRYSPDDAQVTAAVAVFGGEAVISVTDQGPGIPEAERENVFRRFYRILGQGDSDGSGLGLAIVREICWAHGGKVALRDAEEGRGLCVEIELPVRQGDDAQHA